MPEWLSWLIKYCTTELPVLFKRHMVRFALAIVLVVLAIQIAFLNPWFGSTPVKARLIGWMVADYREFHSIIERLAEKQGDKITPFERGAADAGFFEADDPRIVRRWEEEAEQLAWDNLENQSTALRDARLRAETMRRPFQLVGRAAVAASPDCRRDRPGFGKIFINQQRQLGRLLKPDERIKIMNANGGGMPVIASVEFPDRSMPSGVDLYLNKYEMEKMLGQLGMAANVIVSTTKSSVNQVIDDDKPDLLRKCLTADVR